MATSAITPPAQVRLYPRPLLRLILQILMLGLMLSFQHCQGCRLQKIC